MNVRYLIIGGVVLVVIILVAGSIYSGYLGANVGGGQQFTILGPSTLTPGGSATVTWQMSAESAREYPFEKIEYCASNLPQSPCVVLAGAVLNSGEADLEVPVSLPVGQGVLKFTGLNAAKELTTTVATGGVTVVPSP
jgi:hypothetical protein